MEAAADSELPGYFAGLAVDGNPATYWLPREADENWTITLQLQGRCMATSFEVAWKELGGWWLADFDLLYSDDQGLTYLPVQSGILQDPENAVTKLDLGELHATGFMVVLRNPPSSPLWPIGVAEFRVHGVARR